MINTTNHNGIRYQEQYESYGSSPTIYSPSPMYRSHPIYPQVQFTRYYGGGGESHSIDEQDSVDKSTQFIEQQRRIQFLEEELNRKKETIVGLQSQITKYEQEKQAEKKKQSRYWTPEEHTRFLEALSKFGHKDVKSIANYVATRNATQVRTHAQKYFLRIDKERQKKMENSKDSSGSSSNNSSDKESKDHDIYKLDGDYPDDGSPLYSSCSNSPTSHHSISNPFPNSNGSTPTSISSLNLIQNNNNNNNSNINNNHHNNINNHHNNNHNNINHNNNLHSPSSHSSPVVKRKRETVTITASQAKNALLYKDAVLSVMPITWTSLDYDNFSRGLLALIDQDDIHNLCKMIKESFLPQQSIESIEAAYHAFHRAVQQKLSKENNSNNSNSSNTSPNLNMSSSILDSNRSPLKKRPPPVNVPRSEYPVTQLNSSNNSSNHNNSNSNSNSPSHSSVSPNISSSQSSSPIYLQHQYPLPPPHSTQNYSGISTPIGIIHPISPSLPSAPSMRWPLLYETYNIRKGGMEQHISMSPQTPQGIPYGITIHGGNSGNNNNNNSNGGSNNSSFVEVHEHEPHSNNSSWSSPPPPFSSNPNGQSNNGSVDSPNWHVNQTITAFSNTTLNNQNNQNNSSNHNNNNNSNNSHSSHHSD